MASLFRSVLHGMPGAVRVTAVNGGPPHQVVLLPGVVMPAALAYGDLVEALGDGVEAVVKELELYATDAPPPGYSLDVEIDGVLRAADEAGFDRFHLVGYSGGGAVSLALAARHPDRLLSLALMEPAWIGNEGWTAGEQAMWRGIEELRALPHEERMPGFVALQLAPGAEPPPPPPGPPPPWMAKRPAGIEALTDAFGAHALDLAELRSFDRPVYFWLGGQSNPDHYPAMAERLREVFGDFTLDVYEDLHHFKPAHRFEPERLAATLRAFWDHAAALA